MPIVMRLEIPGGTIEQYEQVNEIMGIQGDEDAPDGLIFHVIGKTDDGVLIVDVWESEEKLNRFFERALPAFAETGVPEARPEIMPLHAMIPKGAGSEHNVIMETRANIGPAEYDRMVREIPAHAGDGSQHPVVTHVAAVADDGTLFVMDIWESPEAFGEFAQREIVPVAEEGMQIDPHFVPVHNVIRGAAPVTA